MKFRRRRTRGGYKNDYFPPASRVWWRWRHRRRCHPEDAARRTIWCFLVSFQPTNNRRECAIMLWCCRWMVEGSIPSVEICLPGAAAVTDRSRIALNLPPPSWCWCGYEVGRFHGGDFYSHFCRKWQCYNDFSQYALWYHPLTPDRLDQGEESVGIASRLQHRWKMASSALEKNIHRFVTPNILNLFW